MEGLGSPRRFEASLAKGVNPPETRQQHQWPLSSNVGANNLPRVLQKAFLLRRSRHQAQRVRVVMWAGLGGCLQRVTQSVLWKRGDRIQVHACLSTSLHSIVNLIGLLACARGMP